jgi:hypothetical protein
MVMSLDTFKTSSELCFVSEKVLHHSCGGGFILPYLSVAFRQGKGGSKVRRDHGGKT